MQLVLKIYWPDPPKTLTWSVEMKKKQKTQKIWKSFYLKKWHSLYIKALPQINFIETSLIPYLKLRFLTKVMQILCNVKGKKSVKKF